MKVYIKENSWVARIAAWKLGTKTVAITLGQTIHLYKTNKATFLEDKNWICHELMHVKQFQHYGFLNFIARYLIESFKKGYYNNKWEIEARAAEKNLDLLKDTVFL